MLSVLNDFVYLLPFVTFVALRMVNQLTVCSLLVILMAVFGSSGETDCPVLTTNGHCCVFPFLYQKKWFKSCTTVNWGNTLWCSTTTNYDKDRKWGNCQTTQETDCPVLTTHGECCVFPFLYKKKWYMSCTKVNWGNILWCSTTTNYEKDRKWGNCQTIQGHSCRVETKKGDCCVFPFLYNSTWYHSCTTVDYGNKLWCSTTNNYNVEKKWGTCKTTPRDVFDSVILESEPQEFTEKLEEWLPKTGYWEACWRASRDGWNVETTFHQICDGKKLTLTIVKVVRDGKNYIFGGYATESWGGSFGQTSAPGSFLFSLRNKDKLPPFKAPLKNQSDEWAIYRYRLNGPTYGIGPDFYITNNSNIINNSYINFGYSYKAPAGHSKYYKFSPSEIEVLYLLPVV